ACDRALDRGPTVPHLEQSPPAAAACRGIGFQRFVSAGDARLPARRPWSREAHSARAPFRSAEATRARQGIPRLAYACRIASATLAPLISPLTIANTVGPLPEMPQPSAPAASAACFAPTNPSRPGAPA